MSTVSTLAATVQGFVSKNSPTILVVGAVAGVVTTAVLAAKAGRVAEEAYIEAEDKEIPKNKTAAHLQYAKLTWKFYIPTAVMATATIACIVGGNTISTRRTAAIASAYTLADTAIKEYQSKVVETLGEGKHEKIQDAIAQDRLNANPVTTQVVHIASGGEMLCYDTISGRYFKSDIETLRRAENELNRRLINFSFISLNEMYHEIGLESVKLGDDMGWIPDNMIDFRFSSRIADNNTPCIVLDYHIDPKLDYRSGLH